MRSLPSPLILTIALGLTLAAPPAVRADDQDVVPTGNHVGKVTLPLATVVADPNAGENVQITGSLLVKTVIRYVPGNPCKVQTSFKLGKDAAAVGMTSGSPYTLQGKGSLKYSWVPNNPMRAIDHTGVLVAWPSNPGYPGNPVRVHFHVDYDAASGNVSGASIDFPSNPVLGACHPVAQVCN